MRIPYRGVYTKEILREIERLLQKGPSQEGVRRATRSFAFAAVVCLALGIWRAVNGDGPGAFQWWGIALIPGALAYWNFTALRRSLGASALLGSQVEGEIHEGGVEMVGPTARTHYDWSGFQGQAGNERCLLLQLEGNASVPLPRDFFATASDFEATAAFAREKILVPAPPPSPPLVAWKRVGWLLVFMIFFILAMLAYLTMSS